MTAVAPIPLIQARRYADKIVEWLAPYCERLEVAGSIRRQRPFCADIDIVCIPKITEQKDMLGQVIGRENFCLSFLQNYISASASLSASSTRPRFISGGEKEGKQVILQLPKCQLDLWFADAETFGTRLLCRTGSKEHNVWLCQRAQTRGLHWDTYNGLTNVDLAEPVPASTEPELYTALGLGYIAPKDRERDWLAQNIDSGL